MLWKHGITSLEQISRLSRLSKRVAQQYVDLLPDKIRQQKTKKPKNERAPPVDAPAEVPLLTGSGETEAGTAGAPPALMPVVMP